MKMAETVACPPSQSRVATERRHALSGGDGRASLAADGREPAIGDDARRNAPPGSRKSRRATMVRLGRNFLLDFPVG